MAAIVPAPYWQATRKSVGSSPMQTKQSEADYLLVKGMRIGVAGLFEHAGPHWYWRGFNPIAALWTAVGFLIYMFVIPQPYIQTICTLLITGAGYIALCNRRTVNAHGTNHSLEAKRPSLPIIAGGHSACSMPKYHATVTKENAVQMAVLEQELQTERHRGIEERRQALGTVRTA